MTNLSRRWALVLTILLISGPLVQPASAQPDFTLIPRDEAFPDGISPSHVFSAISKLDASLQKLLDQQGRSNLVYPVVRETGLQPMHVYQMVLTCNWRLQELDDRDGIKVKHVPTISSDPRDYSPRDVYFIVDLMLANVEQIAAKLNVTLDVPAAAASDKTPTDVYDIAVRVFTKLNSLCGHDDVTPNEVYAQMVRAVTDVKSILQQQDAKSRYRIDVARSEPDRTPGDVFQKCLEIRQRLNDIRANFELTKIRVPDVPTEVRIAPRDVFLQTQILIAELNLLKKPLATRSSSPLPIPVESKTPTDVHQKAMLVLFLLDQVKTD